MEIGGYILGTIIGAVLMIAGYYLQYKNKDLMFFAVLLFIPAIILLAFNGFWLNVAWQKFIVAI